MAARIGFPRRQSAFLVLVLLICACTRGSVVELSEHGTLSLATTPQKGISVTLPPAIQGNVRSAGPGLFRFGDPRALPHATFGTISVDTVNPGIIGSFTVQLAGGADGERLAGYLSAIAQSERARPAGPTSRLRSRSIEGRPRPEHLAQGVACDTRRIVAEDRSIPGQPRRVFLTHTLAYTCIDPGRGPPVELTWSERYRAGTNRLSPTFDSDAERFFSSLRFF